MYLCGRLCAAITAPTRLQLRPASVVSERGIGSSTRDLTSPVLRRHFSSQQLVDLFAVVPEELQSSVTAQQLQQDQADAAEYDEATKSHLSALMRAPFVANTSDHMLLFHADRAVNRADLPQVSATFASDGASSSTSTGASTSPSVSFLRIEQLRMVHPAPATRVDGMRQRTPH